MTDEYIRDVVHRLDGLFVGALLEEERDVFIEAIKRGFACRDYYGVSGFLGLAKVKVLHNSITVSH